MTPGERFADEALASIDDRSKRIHAPNECAQKRPLPLQDCAGHWRGGEAVGEDRLRRARACVPRRPPHGKEPRPFVRFLFSARHTALLGERQRTARAFRPGLARHALHGCHSGIRGRASDPASHCRPVPISASPLRQAAGRPPGSMPSAAGTCPRSIGAPSCNAGHPTACCACSTRSR